MNVDNIEMLIKKYQEVTESSDKAKSLVEFMILAKNVFYELVDTLSDEEKLKVIEFYESDKDIITNLICKLSNDEIKMSAIRSFEITNQFQVQVIVRTLSDYENKVALIKEFDLYDYCNDIINLDQNSNNKKLS